MGEASILSEEGGGNPNNLTAEEVRSAVRAGDKLAKTIVTETVDLLIVAIANLISIVDPERIIITGDLAEYGDLFLDPIRMRIQSKFPAATRKFHCLTLRWMHPSWALW